MRKVEAGRGEELESSLPIGERRRRVGSCGVVFCDRNVVRRFVISMVCDIWTRSAGRRGKIELF